jgi:hypothetical protein
MNPIIKDKILSNIEQLLAIEILEYHNKNYLAGDNKTRNQAKRDLLLECVSELGTTAHNHIG